MYREVRDRIGAAVSADATVSPAAAVCLWRRGPGGALEVYMVERAPNLPFLGGYWAFPGGRVEPADDGDRRAAASRELEEEVGLSVDPRALVETGTFVTPAYVASGFEAVYFLVEAPPSAEPDARRSGGELTGGTWVAPAEAIERFRRGAWLVPSPVLRTLAALEQGDRGAPERILAGAEEERRATRLWDLAAGIAVAPVRTPTLPPATHTNCYVVGAGELCVVDPASPYDEERAALDAALAAREAGGARVREIWLTHHHLDHVSGAAHLAARLGVPVAAHAETASRLAGVVRVDRLLEDGDTLSLAGEPGRRLRAVFTPGHAPGHLCFLEEETGFLLCGDMVAGVGTILVDPDEGDMGEYLASLGRMKHLGARRLLPSHGGVLSDPVARLDEYVRHRLWREERVFSALAGRGAAAASELVPHAYADVPAALHPLAERSLLAHLHKLEADGRIRRDGQQWEIAG